MRNQDDKLDLYLALDKFGEVNENEAILCVYHDKESANFIILCQGDSEVLSSPLSIDGYINTSNREQKQAITESKHMILNIAINILKRDEKLKKVFDSLYKKL